VTASLVGESTVNVNGVNDGWIKLYDITNATYIYSPYWNRG
jgi:hypothetical protein